jgi:hypothetical protein
MDGVRRAIRFADTAVLTKVINAKIAWQIHGQWQISQYSRQSNIGAVFSSNQ